MQPANHTHLDETVHASTEAMQQYLSFTVRQETYGVDIMRVREIKGWTETTRIPESPDYMRGVMNLRGAIIPIFDLRVRFCGEQTQANASNVVIILALKNRNIGLLVDAVSDILTVSEQEIKPAPQVDHQTGNPFISGIISIEQRMVVLLDIEHLFDESTLMDEHASAA